MHPTTIIRRFQDERPRAKIAPRVRDGSDCYAFTITARDAHSAVQCDPCECTIARAARREFGEAAIVLKHSAYVLERQADGTFAVVKYLHDGSEVVAALDELGVAIPNTVITLRPPSRSRAVGAQSLEQKAHPAFRRGPQSVETIRRRKRSIARSASRQRLTALAPV